MPTSRLSQTSILEVPLLNFFRKFFAEREALFLRVFADGALALNRVADLLEEALCKILERLLHSPAATVRQEKCGRFPLDRLT